MQGERRRRGLDGAIIAALGAVQRAQPGERAALQRAIAGQPRGALGLLQVGEREMRLGSTRLMEELGVQLDAMAEQADALRAEGRTV